MCFGSAPAPRPGQQPEAIGQAGLDRGPARGSATPHRRELDGARRGWHRPAAVQSSGRRRQLPGAPSEAPAPGSLSPGPEATRSLQTAGAAAHGRRFRFLPAAWQPPQHRPRGTGARRTNAQRRWLVARNPPAAGQACSSSPARAPRSASDQGARSCPDPRSQRRRRASACLAARVEGSRLPKGSERPANRPRATAAADFGASPCRGAASSTIMDLGSRSRRRRHARRRATSIASRVLPAPPARAGYARLRQAASSSCDSPLGLPFEATDRARQRGIGQRRRPAASPGARSSLRTTRATSVDAAGEPVCRRRASAVSGGSALPGPSPSALRQRPGVLVERVSRPPPRPTITAPKQGRPWGHQNRRAPAAAVACRTSSAVLPSGSRSPPRAAAVARIAARRRRIAYAVTGWRLGADAAARVPVHAMLRPIRGGRISSR
jgi:hypothetical protein